MDDFMDQFKVCIKAEDCKHPA